MIKITTSQTKKNKDFVNKFASSEYIPYELHWDNSTILTKNHELIQVIKVEGLSFESVDDVDLEIKKNLRNSLYKSLETDNIELYFHTLRQKAYSNQNLSDHNDNFSNHTKVNFTKYLESAWNKKYASNTNYINRLYVTIIYKANNTSVSIFEYWYNKIIKKNVQDSWKQEIVIKASKIYEVSSKIINSLSEYKPKLLSIQSINGGYHSEIIEFLTKVANFGYSAPVLLSHIPINQYIVNHRLSFNGSTITMEGLGKKKYGGLISIKEYCSSTNTLIFDQLLKLPFEFIVSQSFDIINKSDSIKKLELQQNRMIQNEDRSISQIEEISLAIDMASSGEIGFGNHHFTILCVSDSQEELENSLSLVSVELSNIGIKSIKETTNLEGSYWGQLPGNSKYIIRKAKINSLNISSFATMHNYPTGQKYNNYWGNFVTTLDTSSFTSYYFSFHVKDVGHTMIIGPTGSGKTILMNFLCAQAQQFSPRTYLFDKDKGSKIFIKSIGGNYTELNSSTKSYFNPLQLDETGENKRFLLEWLQLLVTTNGETLTEEENKLLNIAIEGNYRLNKKDRKLSNIAPFLGVASANSIASRLEKWYGNGNKAMVFDNGEDKIDLLKNKIFGFDMTDILQDKVSMPAILSYIFHKIRLSLDGTPTIIAMDEAWALIDNPIFAPKIKNWLKVFRKLNALIIFATQSVEDAYKSEISDTLVQQTATQIFLPNLKATDAYKKVFMLTEREFNIIKGTDPSSRFFLVKQGLDSVVARINLFGMDDIISVLSSNANSISLLEELIKKHGDNPTKWLIPFYNLS